MEDNGKLELRIKLPDIKGIVLLDIDLKVPHAYCGKGMILCGFIWIIILAGMVYHDNTIMITSIKIEEINANKSITEHNIEAGVRIEQIKAQAEETRGNNAMKAKQIEETKAYAPVYEAFWRTAGIIFIFVFTCVFAVIWGCCGNSSSKSKSY